MLQQISSNAVVYPGAQAGSGLAVVEMYKSILGEGALMGIPAVVVRFAGCDYSCAWCNVKYATVTHQDQWSMLDTNAIWAQISNLSPTPIWVMLTGGNPALHNLEPLIDRGHLAGYKFALETQGSIPKLWMKKIEHIMVSPPPPSSGMPVDWVRVAACLNFGQESSLKITIETDEDYQFAKLASKKFPMETVYLQPCLKTEPFDYASSLSRVLQLMGMVLADGWHEVIVLPQLQVLLHGTCRGCVV